VFAQQAIAGGELLFLGLLDLLAGLFLSLGQVLRFQLRTVSSLRSSARFSGFCALKPRCASRQLSPDSCSQLLNMVSQCVLQDDGVMLGIERNGPDGLPIARIA
jgi:hypothetical protein